MTEEETVAAIVAFIREELELHERGYKQALERGDQASMDRCAARARTCSRLAQNIEVGAYK